MNLIELICFWIAIGFYTFSLIFMLMGILFNKSFMSDSSRILIIAGFIFHTISGLSRWHSTGHPPVLAGYENSLTGSWFVIFVGLILKTKYRTAEYFFLFILPFVLLMLGNGLISDSEYISLTPSFKSPWLAVHVLFAWLSYSSFAVAAGVSVYYLLGYFKIIKTVDADLRKMDDINLRLVGFGFITHTVMVGAGAIWAYNLWGSYWSWDPVETWSLITWLAYGINIHLQLTIGWRGLKGAIITILCLVMVIITYFGVGLIPALHIQLL